MSTEKEKPSTKKKIVEKKKKNQQTNILHHLYSSCTPRFFHHVGLVKRKCV